MSPPLRARLGVALRLALAAALLWWASGLFWPTLSTEHGSSDRARALGCLEAQIEAGAPERMQLLFPEGYLFTVLPTALAEVEQGLASPEGSAERAHALAVAKGALVKLEGEDGTGPFNAELDPPYGVFYRGWLAWLKVRILALDLQNEALAASLERDGDAITRALARSPSPYLEAYTGMAWPCDTVVAVAALAAYDRARTPRYAAARARWLEAVRPTLDASTGLFPHQVEPRTGQGRDGPRGTSSALILHFLPEIDAKLAADQYGHFHETFVVTRLGLPGVRERADARDPWLPLVEAGDIDSGPLLTGLSLSASAVAIGAAARNGDLELAQGFARAAELAGLRGGITQKRTLGGLMPVADALLVWAEAAPVVDARPYPTRLLFGGRLPALVFTLIGLGALLAPLFRATVGRGRA